MGTQTVHIFSKGIGEIKEESRQKYCTGQLKAGRQSMFSCVMGTQTVQKFSKGIGEIKEGGRRKILYRSVKGWQTLYVQIYHGHTDCPDIFSKDWLNQGGRQT